MFRKVVQDFTNVATKPDCLGPFQRSLPQQELALPNAYESNDRNVTGLSYKKNTTKVQQLETFPTQYIGVSKFLFGRIPAGGSSGIAKPSLGGDVQFKKLGDIARLNPALCHSESQPVGFGAIQQTVKNILAEGEKSGILSGIWGLMQNPINRSFREGEMVKGNAQDAGKSQQLETLKSENKKLKGENQQLGALKSENEELKVKLQEFKNKSKELKEELDRKTSEVNTLTEGKEQLEESLNSAKQSLNEKDKELENIKTQFAEKERELNSANQRALQLEQEQGTVQQQLKALEDGNNNLKIKLRKSENRNKELESKIQELEELKSANRGKIQQLESRVKELEALQSASESKIQDLQKQLESKNKELEDNKDRKPLAVNVQGVKGKVNYASASFILSGVCAVGVSLATPYLAICATLAVAASVFLALGCYCLYKANTTLSNVEVDQQDNQRLLESSL